MMSILKSVKSYTWKLEIMNDFLGVLLILVEREEYVTLALLDSDMLGEVFHLIGSINNLPPLPLTVD